MESTEQGSLSIDLCFAGEVSEGRASVSQLVQQIGYVDVNTVHVRDFVEWQQAFDKSFDPPMRGYWKALYKQELTAETIELLLAAFEHCPSGDVSILLEHLHGAFRKSRPESSAFSHRDKRFGILMSSRWLKEQQDGEHVAWVRDAYSRLDPTGKGGAYLNYLNADEDTGIHRAMSSENLERLMVVKGKYDPGNVLRRNFNVLPRAVGLG
jgi:hypothetical protein